MGPGHSLPSERLRVLETEFREKSVRARQAFDDFCARHHIAPGSTLGVRGHFSFHEAAGIEPDETIRQARYRDLTVVAREGINDAFSIDKLGALVMGSGKPVLISPPKAAGTFAERIVIAWKDTAEAARAVLVVFLITVSFFFLLFLL